MVTESLSTSRLPGVGVLAVVAVASGRPDRPDYERRLWDLEGAVVARAKERGWDPVLLYAGELGPDRLLAATSAADAVIILGGEDVTPQFYGGPADYPGSGRHNKVADDAEIQLIRRAVAESHPLIGICRGAQIVNVALGGDLIQHLPNAPLHVAPSPSEPMIVHDIAVTPGSRVAALADDGQHIRSVRSGHHQAINRLAPDLRAVAWAPDGTIEAIEHNEAPVLAIQWHPEDAGAPASHLDALLHLLEDLTAVG
jgi:putative glutamine amidotransferase